MIEKIKRLHDSIEKESNPDVIKSLKAVASGMANFYFKNSKSKIKAKERYDNSCSDCAFNVMEPIPDLRVKDSEIPELSNRMCAHCGGCVLSYKLRQSVKKCEFWKN